MKVLPQVKRAALFAADVLSSVDLKPFLKKHGIKDKLYSKRLVDRLRSTYSLQPAPRQGRPRVYTADELQAAQDELTRPSQPVHSTRQLVQRLKEGGSCQQAPALRASSQHLSGTWQSRGCSWAMAPAASGSQSPGS